MSTRPAHPERIEEQRLLKPGLARCIISSYATLWLSTVLFALIAIPFASPLRDLFGFHGGLATSGNAGMAAFITANNTREAAIPFLFAVLRVGARRWPIVLGDIVIAACLTTNMALGGLALGTDGMPALPYLPHWPLEWAGLALALTAWRRARMGRRDPCELALLAMTTAFLLCLAALLETYAVPQG